MLEIMKISNNPYQFGDEEGEFWKHFTALFIDVVY